MESTMTSTAYGTSKLILKGGFEVIENFTNPAFFKQLQQEALSSMKYASRSEIGDPLHMPERGGQPARKLSSAPGGPCLEAFNHDSYVLDSLEQIVGRPVSPSGSQGTFSYYVKEGDHLALHRDILVCDLAVINSLYDDTPPDSQDGVLAIYSDRKDEKLAEITQTPLEKRKLVKLKEGQTIVMLGGIVPHMVLPMTSNFKRIISVNCYKVKF